MAVGEREGDGMGRQRGNEGDRGDKGGKLMRKRSMGIESGWNERLNSGILKNMHTYS